MNNKKINITILDAKTLGDDISLDTFSQYGQVKIYDFTSEKEKLERCINADIIVTNKVKLDKKLLKLCNNLKLIAITATGVNNVDLQTTKKLNIQVKNVLNYSSNSVAQHTFGMVLSLVLDIRGLDYHIQSREYEKSNSFTYWNKNIFELSSKKWGIIGLGAIGQKVAGIAKKFGCDIYVFSPTNQTYNTPHNQIKKLKIFLKICDIVSIHTPLNKFTNNLITKKELMYMSDKSVIVNVARGRIINENDLCEVLDTKELYVGLDVLEQEPIKPNHPLLNIKHKNRLLITPHTAWASFEARQTIIKQTKEHMQNFIDNN